MFNRNAKNYLKVLGRKSVFGVSHSEEDNGTDDFTSTMMTVMIMTVAEKIITVLTVGCLLCQALCWMLSI